MLVALVHILHVHNIVVIMSLVERILYPIYLTVLMYLVAKHIVVSSIHILLDYVHVENVVVISAVYA